jgi:predicted NAD/FAD-binding protein
VRGDDDAPASITYNMNSLQTLEAEQTYCVTLNAADAIDPRSVIYHTEYSHPVYTREGMRAQARRSEISGVHRTHYCGAYWGFGFHEDGVRSAVEVAATFGAGL